jgi:phytoene dehydrogenase-like protein
MLFCPVMYYGSPQEHDMDFGQFVIMFKALFLEGFARPFEGVRVVIRALLAKYREAGGERRMKCGVRRILAEKGRASVLVLDSGEEIRATEVLSSIGSAETEAVASRGGEGLSFAETITVLDRDPAQLGLGEDTIVFFNDSQRFEYRKPSSAVDVRSGVICIPNHFDFGAGRALEEGWFRCTCLAGRAAWAALASSDYSAAKAEWYRKIQDSARRFLPGAVPAVQLAAATRATDMFTPLTISRFTGHFGGAIYGAPLKSRQGLTSLENVHLCGTDQGFLGIIGAMLSGISMANYHILQKG